ncbi:MAG: TonB family protein [Bacteroidetes bacterium]|nr:TonB family protein [Bacteroidota bacterium]
MQLLPYIAQVNLYWLLLYACYWLLLRRHTFFAWNRAYLLASLLGAFALPLVEYPEAAPVVPAVTYAVASLPPTVITAQSAAEPVATLPDWLVLLGTLYAVGVGCMGIRLGLFLRKLYRLFGQGEEIPMDGYTLILLEANRVGSFSFLNRIVISRTDYEHHLDTVLNHELVHVQQRHSWDILLVEVLRVLFWFNPVLILYKRSLQQVHEYLADGQAILQSAGRRDQYAEFLVAYALHAPVATLTKHFFNTSLLKSRITMLYKNRNSKWALGRYAVVLPLVGLVLMLTAARERVADALETSLPAGTETFLSFPETPLAQSAELPPALVETTTVRGTVRSSKTKEPLPFANVLLVGTNTGTTTDVNGNFELKEVPLSSMLAISYINYKPRLVEITKPNQVVNVVLEWQQSSFGKTVVVTYGSPASPAPDTNLNADKPNGKEFIVVEQLPEFPGGMQEMHKYLGRNIRYPSDAFYGGIEGEVLIRIVINDQGRVRDPQVIKRLGGGTDEEALRVVLNMPTWKPAMQNGRPVPTEYILPIEFKIEKPEPKEDKEKRQGKASNFRNYFNDGKAVFTFDKSFDVGTPVSIRNFGAPTVTMPATNDSKGRFMNFYPVEKFTTIISKDSIR